MKIVLIGANGTIGQAVFQRMQQDGHEVIRVGRQSGDLQADVENFESVQALYAKIGSFDAVANASGKVAFAPLEKLGQAEWEQSFRGKFMGQVNLVQAAIPYIRERGSFTLVSGVLGDEPILGSVAGSSINRALEGFVMAAACELPKALRINIVSPTLLEESRTRHGKLFAGFATVPAREVAEAYAKSMLGIQTGKVFRVQ